MGKDLVIGQIHVVLIFILSPMGVLLPRYKTMLHPTSNYR